MYLVIEHDYIQVSIDPYKYHVCKTKGS